MFNNRLSFCKIHNLMGDYRWDYWPQAPKNQATPLLPCVTRRLTYTTGRIRRADGWRVAVEDREGKRQVTNRDVQNIAGAERLPGPVSSDKAVRNTKVELSCPCPHHEGIWGSTGTAPLILHLGPRRTERRGPCFDCPEGT